MKTQEEINFARIAEAIAYIQENFKRQPDLEEVAEKVNLSPFHFQRLFSDWAGVSPKKFLQYITLNNAKRMLKNPGATLFDAALENGLSGTGRLHDLFVSIEGMTPGEYKNGGQSLAIHYSFAVTIFGKILLASTNKGICYTAFADNEDVTLGELKKLFPAAQFEQKRDTFHDNILHVFTADWNVPENIKLHLKGTEFQVKVWETLLKIPMGRLSTYGEIARRIERPTASRAVGTAIGDNPIAFLIPCHRVIQSGGAFGQYHWGSARKAAIIGWEAAFSGGRETPEAI